MIRNGAAALLAFATLVTSSQSPAQRSSASRYDPLEAFVGTWVATNANERAPYMVLRFEERGGKLVGAMNHFHLRIDHGTLGGSQPTSGEIPLPDLSVGRGDLGFTWRVNPPLEGAPVKFVVEGTQVAELVFSLQQDAMQRIMAENPRAVGLNPVIYLRRVSGDALHPSVGADVTAATPRTSQKWEAAAMARLINTAEVQYKAAHGQYADYTTLFRSGQLRETGERKFTLLPGNLRREATEPDYDPLPGYLFRLLLSPDRNSYRLSMMDKSRTVCPYDVITDQTGIVTEVSILGCSSRGAP